MAYRPSTLTEDDYQQLKAVLNGCPELATAHRLVREFGDMLTHQTGVLLPAWIEDAVEANLPGLTGFARGLAAVTAGLALRWNSGGTEGAVNRITKIKRQRVDELLVELLGLVGHDFLSNRSARAAHIGRPDSGSRQANPLDGRLLHLHLLPRRRARRRANQRPDPGLATRRPRRHVHGTYAEGASWTFAQFRGIFPYSWRLPSGAAAPQQRSTAATARPCELQLLGVSPRAADMTDR
ncbi:hypothetical protein [Streptomyces sp. R41]|uniref:Transposase IS204/IS1001/IS1096/IS1165 DDE domain-containing protein n=1 Tax=Streptomyces sp. R41 TaxID=3238632 RepID=A0AB39R8L7_9ACTN